MNYLNEPYTWTDTAPEDDPEFQGLLKEEGDALFPDVSVEIPGVPIKEEDGKYQNVTNEPKPGFKTLMAAALNNAGIDVATQVCSARAAADVADAVVIAVPPDGQLLVEAFEDKIVHNVTFELPDAGLVVPNEYENDATIETDAGTVTPPPSASSQRSPS